MSDLCPRTSMLTRALDGELPRSAEAELDEHVRGCASCQAERAALGQLFADLAAPVPGPSAEAQVSRVLEAVRAGREASPLPRRRPWAWAASGALAAACVALMMVRSGAPPALQARGGRVERSLSRAVGVRVRAGGTPLEEGASVEKDAAFTATYTNLLADRPAPFLLLFAIDAAGEVHWLYPAYLERDSDPQAVALPPVDHPTPLPDSVVLDDPAPGGLRLVSIVSPTRLSVSAIERLSASERDTAALAHRWPDAAIESMSVHVRAEVRP